MRGRINKVTLSQYVSPQTLERIHRALNIPFKDNARNGHPSKDEKEEEDGEVLDEDVPGYN